jgi:large conductance mechanosensitive channel
MKISNSLKSLLLKGDLVAVAAALLVGMAAYFFIQAVVEGLIGPLIAAIFDESGLYSLGFNIGSAEFGYGYALSALIVLVLAVIAVVALDRVRGGAEWPSSET